MRHPRFIRAGAGRAAADAPRRTVAEVGEAAEADGPLDQAALWDAVAARLRDGDVVIADQGTAFYGMGTHRMPHGVTFIGQPLWAAIGYTLPALLGAALADRSRRPIVLIGDGAAQLTIAELGTLIRDRVPAIVVIVNNLGYTVERAIHGLTAEYNDIAPWNWTAVVKAFDPDRLHALRRGAHRRRGDRGVRAARPARRSATGVHRGGRAAARRAAAAQRARRAGEPGERTARRLRSGAARAVGGVRHCRPSPARNHS